MQAANPAAAADAWLSRLPNSERLAAHAATDVRLLGWIAGLTCMAGVCVAATRLVASPRFRASLESGGRPAWLIEGCVAACLGAAVALAKAVVDALFGWRSDAILAAAFGSPQSSLLAELRDAASGAPLVVACAAIGVPPLIWLMRRAPKSWAWLTFPVLATGILAAAWLPYALALGPDLPPAPEGAARAGLQRLVGDAHLPIRQIYVSRQMGLDADLTGGLAPPRLVVGAALLDGPVAQSRAYVGHLMGHYAHADILLVSLVLCGVAAAGLATVAMGAAPLARWFGATGARRASDLESLPAAALIVVLTLYGAGLAAGGYLRWANVRADAFSLDHAREPDGLAGAIERDWDHDSVDPSQLEEAVFYSHPPLGSRLRQAMVWKAAHCVQSKGASFRFS